MRNAIPPLSKSLYQFFSFGYYIFLCPIRPTYNINTRRFSGSSHHKLIQVGYLIFATVPGLNLMIEQASFGTAVSSAASAKDGLRIVLSNLDMFGWLMASAAFKMELWLEREHLADVLNSLVDVERLTAHFTAGACSKVVNLRYAGALAIGVHVLMSVGSWIQMCSSLATDTSTWGGEEVSKWSVLYRAILVSCAHVENQFVLYGLKLVCLLSVTQLGLALCLQRLTEHSESAFEIRRAYIHLLRYLAHMRKCFGFSIAGFFIFPLGYYAHQLESFFSVRWYLWLLNIHDLFEKVITLLAGAEAHTMLTSLISFWGASSDMVTDTVSLPGHFSRFQCKMLLFHVSNLNVFAVGGRVFALTYGFVGTMAACIVGYSITIVQLRGVD